MENTHYGAEALKTIAMTARNGREAVDNLLGMTQNPELIDLLHKQQREYEEIAARAEAELGDMDQIGH